MSEVGCTARFFSILSISAFNHSFSPFLSSLCQLSVCLRTLLIIIRAWWGRPSSSLHLAPPNRCSSCSCLFLRENFLAPWHILEYIIIWDIHKNGESRDTMRPLVGVRPIAPHHLPIVLLAAAASSFQFSSSSTCCRVVCLVSSS